jgi:hypothetical protein
LSCVLCLSAALDVTVVVVVVVFFYDAQLVAFVISTSHSTLEKTHFFSPLISLYLYPDFYWLLKQGLKERERKKKQ